MVQSRGASGGEREATASKSSLKSGKEEMVTVKSREGHKERTKWELKALVEGRLSEGGGRMKKMS